MGRGGEKERKEGERGEERQREKCRSCVRIKGTAKRRKDVKKEKIRGKEKKRRKKKEQRKKKKEKKNRHFGFFSFFSFFFFSLYFFFSSFLFSGGQEKHFECTFKIIRKRKENGELKQDSRIIGSFFGFKFVGKFQKGLKGFDSWVLDIVFDGGIFLEFVGNVGHQGHRFNLVGHHP